MLLPIQRLQQYHKFFTLFCCVCLLSISSTVSVRVLVTVEGPNEVFTTVPLTRAGTETFDGLTYAPDPTHTNYNASFDQGRLYDGSQWVRARYSKFRRNYNGVNGGAGIIGSSGYYVSCADEPMVIEIQNTTGIRYFALHLGSVVDTNVLQFYHGTSLVYTLLGSEIISGLQGKNEYLGSKIIRTFSTTVESRQSKDPTKLFGFFNFFFFDDEVTRIVLKAESEDKNIDTDNHTVGEWTKTHGMPLRREVVVTVQPPHVTRSNTPLIYGGRETFSRFTESTRHTDFGTENEAVRIHGVYTGDLNVVNSGPAGGAERPGKYVANYYQLELNLTKTGPHGLDYFEVYIGTLDKRNKMTFYNDDEEVFSLWGSTLEDHLYNHASGYYGNPTYHRTHYIRHAFACVSFFFYGKTYNRIVFTHDHYYGYFETDNHTPGFFRAQTGTRIQT